MADPTRPPPRPPGWTAEDGDDESGGSAGEDSGGEGDDSDADDTYAAWRGQRRDGRRRGGSAADGNRNGGGGRSRDRHRGGQAGESDDEGEEEIPPVRVHPNGLSSRVVRVRVPPGRLEQLAVLWDDQLIYTRLQPPDGVGSRSGGDGGAWCEEDERDGDDEGAGTLVRCELGSGRETELIADVLEFALSADLATVAVLCDEDGERALRVYEAGIKPAQETVPGLE